MKIITISEYKVNVQCINYIIYILLFSLFSCSDVHFDNSMPIQKKSLRMFDSTINGKYDYQDSVLKLKDDTYYNYKYFNNSFTSFDSCSLVSAVVSVSKTQFWYNFNLKSYYRISKFDTIRLANKHRKEKKSFIDNYLVFEGEYSDTLINLNKKDKLKFHKGKYYLNHFIAEHDWEVYQVEIGKNGLFSINLTNKEDEKQLTNYLIKRKEIFGNIVHISDSQFDNFIQKGGFRNKYSFIKCQSK